MTKFITYYNLCSIPDSNEFLGIAADREDGRIITTLGRNIVIIQISNQKQIHSWKTLEKLSTKVVFDQKSQKYIGVFANRYVRCWDETTTDVNKCKKLKFYKNIADLVCTEKITMVIYSDGTCEELTAAIQSRKNHEHEQTTIGLTPNVLISNTKLSLLADGGKCLTFFELQQNNKAPPVLVKINLDSKQDELAVTDVKKFVLKRENLDVNVAGYAVIDGDDAPMLLTIWSDKRLFLLNLNDAVEPEKSPGNFVSMLNVLKVDTPLSIIGISKHFIAIYGANNGQDGAFLLLYNTQFKVIKAKQFFKIYFNYSRLWAVDEHILLAMGQNLSVVSYRISKELLSEFVGTQSSNDFQTAIENDHINEEESFQENIQFIESSNNETHVNNFSMKTSDKDVIFADGKFVPFESVNGFDQELSALNNFNMHIDIVQADKTQEDFQINLMSNVYDDGFSTNEVQLIARQLENCGASEHEITEKLLHVLIKSNLMQDIAVCLRRYTNISEKMLAKTLKYILKHIVRTSNELDALEANTKESSDAEIANQNNTFALNGEVKEDLPNADILLEKYHNVSTIKDYTSLLDVLLCCSFEAENIAPYIRKELSYLQVQFMLEYLYAILKKENNSQYDMFEFGGDSINFELQIFRWFGVFLNAHYQKLVLSKDIQLIDLFAKWHNLLELYKKEFVELEEVLSLLYSIVQRKKIVKEVNYSKWYSIEEVDLY